MEYSEGTWIPVWPIQWNATAAYGQLCVLSFPENCQADKEKGRKDRLNRAEPRSRVHLTAGASSEWLHAHNHKTAKQPEKATLQKNVQTYIQGKRADVSLVECGQSAYVQCHASSSWPGWQRLYFATQTPPSPSSHEFPRELQLPLISFLHGDSSVLMAEKRSESDVVRTCQNLLAKHLSSTARHSNERRSKDPWNDGP